MQGVVSSLIIQKDKSKTLEYAIKKGMDFGFKDEIVKNTVTKDTSVCVNGNHQAFKISVSDFLTKKMIRFVGPLYINDKMIHVQIIGLKEHWKEFKSIAFLTSIR